MYVCPYVRSENVSSNVKNEVWAAMGVLLIVTFLAITFGHGFRLYQNYFIIDTNSTFQVDKDWFLFNQSGGGHRKGANGRNTRAAHAGGGGGGGGGARLPQSMSNQHALLEDERREAMSHVPLAHSHHVGQDARGKTASNELPSDEPSFTCQNCGIPVGLSYRFCPRCKHDLRSL